MGVRVTVIRHPRENLKKCSLRHLHSHPDFDFQIAVDKFLFDATGFILLEIDAPTISSADKDKPILLLDSTWNLLPKIRGKIVGNYVPRSLPPSIRTAYPRISKMHEDPSGLATVEALYAAQKLMGSPDIAVLKNYPFAKKFLEINGWQSDIPSPDFFDGTGQIEVSPKKKNF